MKKIRINKYVLTTPKPGQNVKIMVISDLHGDIGYLEKLLILLKERQPDYILIPGDLIDAINDEDNPTFLQLFTQMGTICPTIIALGNHDIVALEKGEVTDIEPEYLTSKLRRIPNIILLDQPFNQYSLNPDVVVSAVNFTNAWYHDGEKVEDTLNFLRNLAVGAKITKNSFNILLTHSSNGFLDKGKINGEIDYILSNCDLILTGHNHGGLTPRWLRFILPAHFGLVGPYRRIFFSTSHGYWQNEHSTLIVSDGFIKAAKSANMPHLSKIINALFIPDIDEITINFASTRNLQQLPSEIREFKRSKKN